MSDTFAARMDVAIARLDARVAQISSMNLSSDNARLAMLDAIYDCYAVVDKDGMTRDEFEQILNHCASDVEAFLQSVK